MRRLVACGTAAFALCAPVAVSAADATVTLTGAIKLTHTTGVTDCSSNPPGHSLMSGYQMDLKHDDVIESGGVHVSSSHGDGTYAVPTRVKSLTEDPLQISFLRSATFPRGSTIAQVKGSTLTVTISHGGKAGIATFKHWEMLYPDHAVVSGTLKWSCP